MLALNEPTDNHIKDRCQKQPEEGDPEHATEHRGAQRLAHLSADWTDATTFETIVYGMDLDLFKKAFVEGDVDALRSEGMAKAFEQFRTMVTKYMDPAIAGRDYDSASNMMAKWYQ